MVIQEKNVSQKISLVRPHNLLRKIKVYPRTLVVFGAFDWNSHLAKMHFVTGARKDLGFCSLQTLMVNNKPITLAGPVMTAPVAAMALEVLIAFGTRHIIGVGSCGSLDKKLRIGDILIPQNAVSDEGTSSHYPLPGKKIKASQKIVEMLQALCGAKGLPWTCGTAWTTDAVFRETPQNIKKAQHKNAIAVEMELSAFFKVGAFYGVDVGALLAVSDELFSHEWNSGYGNPQFKETFVQVLDIGIQALAQIDVDEEKL